MSRAAAFSFRFQLKAGQLQALWASAQLTDKLTVQSALFPEGILYRADIGFFEPPDDRLSALVFRLLIELAEHPEAYEEEEILSGRALLPILNRIARLRTCLKSFQPKRAHD